MVCIIFSCCDPLMNNLRYEIVTLNNKLYDSYYPVDDFESKPNIRTKIDELSYTVWLTNNGNLKIFDSNGLEIIEYDVKLPEESGKAYRLRANYHEEENFLWICAEKWDAYRFNGYVDDTLVQSKIIGISLSNFKVQIDKELDKNELFLIVHDTKVYFYKKNIVYRKDLNDWENEENVCKINTDDMSILNFDMSEAGKIYISGNLYNNGNASMPVPPKQVVIITLEEESENSDLIP